MNTVCVVGASLAGLLTARALRGQGHEGRIVVVGEEPHRPYDRPPLSKDFLKGAIGEADLALEGEGGEPGIEWRLGVAATGLDAPARRITLSDGGTLTADGIVIATGAAARRLPGTAGWPASTPCAPSTTPARCAPTCAPRAGSSSSAAASSAPRSPPPPESWASTSRSSSRGRRRWRASSAPRWPASWRVCTSGAASG